MIRGDKMFSLKQATFLLLEKKAPAYTIMPAGFSFTSIAVQVYLTCLKNRKKKKKKKLYMGHSQEMVNLCAVCDLMTYC